MYTITADAAMIHREQLQCLVFCATDEQIQASWVREQEYRRDRGESFYRRLIDPKSGKVLVEISEQPQLRVGTTGSWQGEYPEVTCAR
jgi:hypothetical protein